LQGGGQGDGQGGGQGGGHGGGHGGGQGLQGFKPHFESKSLRQSLMVGRMGGLVFESSEESGSLVRDSSVRTEC